MTTLSYRPCSITFSFRLFLKSVGILWGSFALFLHYFKNYSGKITVSSKELLLYNFVYCSPKFFMMFVYILNFVDIFNVNVQCLLICFFLSFLFKINLHLIASFMNFTDLRFCCDIFIIILFYSHRRYFRICIIYLCSSQTSSQFINNTSPLNVFIII